MKLNGKTVKIQGVANHQDFHGLAVAAPMRAMQRRLAQLKALGVNAIRPSHDPRQPGLPRPHRSAWAFWCSTSSPTSGPAHKYSDVGDYAAYFNQTATSTPTGHAAVPTVPGVTNAGATWWTGRPDRLASCATQSSQRRALQYGERDPRFDQHADAHPHQDGRHEPCARSIAERHAGAARSGHRRGRRWGTNTLLDVSVTTTTWRTASRR